MGNTRTVSNKQNQKEEPGESGLPSCLRNIGSQTVFGTLLKIGDKYFAVSGTECANKKRNRRGFLRANGSRGTIAESGAPRQRGHQPHAEYQAETKGGARIL